MAIAAKPKPKSYYKKRHGGHHRQSKNYSKVYYPYLPMIGIIGTGLMANSIWPSTLSASADPIDASRLAAISGVHSASLYYLVIALTIVAFTALVLTHVNRFRRLIKHGEAYIIKHPAYDISLVLVITTGVLLVRA